MGWALLLGSVDGVGVKSIWITVCMGPCSVVLVQASLSGRHSGARGPHQVVPQGLEEATEGLGPDVLLMPLGQGCAVGRVGQGQRCPFKVLFLEDAGVAGEAGSQPADVRDALGDHVVADGAEVRSLPQGGELLVLDGDLQVRADVKFS